MSNIKLEDFKGLKAKINFEKIIDQYGQETVNDLKNRRQWKRNRHNKSYNDGWTFLVKSKKENNYGGTVWNATNYQLTHLLEKGHLIVNKKGGVGWASAFPHIDPVYRSIKPKFEQAMEKVEIEIDFI